MPGWNNRNTLEQKRVPDKKKPHKFPHKSGAVKMGGGGKKSRKP